MPELEKAYDRLQKMAPDRIARAIGWVRRPSARWLRMPIGVLCLAGGCLWFLPVLGIWMLPLGVLLLAQDVPPTRRPVGKMMLRLLDRCDALGRRWSKWRKRRNQTQR